MDVVNTAGVVFCPLCWESFSNRQEVLMYDCPGRHLFCIRCTGTMDEDYGLRDHDVRVRFIGAHDAPPILECPFCSTPVCVITVVCAADFTGVSAVPGGSAVNPIEIED